MERGTPHMQGMSVMPLPLDGRLPGKEADFCFYCQGLLALPSEATGGYRLCVRSCHKSLLAVECKSSTPCSGSIGPRVVLARRLASNSNTCVSLLQILTCKLTGSRVLTRKHAAYSQCLGKCYRPNWATGYRHDPIMLRRWMTNPGWASA